MKQEEFGVEFTAGAFTPQRLYQQPAAFAADERTIR